MLRDISELVDRIISDGKISEKELAEFQAAIAEDGRVDREEHEQIMRVLTLIQENKLEVE